MSGFYGGEKQTYDLIEALSRRGHKIYLLALPKSELANKVNCSKIYFDLRPYPDSRIRSLIFFLKLPFYKIKINHFLNKFITDHPIDLVCMQEPYEKIAFSRFFKKKGIPIVWLEILYWEPFLSANKLLFRLMIKASRECDRVIASSRFLRNQIKKYINQSKIVLIRHALTKSDQNKLRQIRKRAIGPITTLGFAGNLSKLKGIFILVSAFKQVIKRFPKLKLYFAGSGAERENLDKTILRDKFSNRVFMLGKQDIAVFFKRIDLLITPSLYDNLPYVLQEAICAKLPVITTNQGGMPEYFRDKVVRSYCLAKPNESHDLASKIIKIINLPPEKLNYIVVTNFDFYQNNFIFSDMIIKIERLFAKIIFNHSNKKI